MQLNFVKEKTRAILFVCCSFSPLSLSFFLSFLPLLRFSFFVENTSFCASSAQILRLVQCRPSTKDGALWNAVAVEVLLNVLFLHGHNFNTGVHWCKNLSSGCLRALRSPVSFWIFPLKTTCEEKVVFLSSFVVGCMSVRFVVVCLLFFFFECGKIDFFFLCCQCHSRPCVRRVTNGQGFRFPCSKELEQKKLGR